MRVSSAVVVGLVLFTAVGGVGARQSAAPVDFVRDVQPILRERCVGCHGPTLQQAGYRLDRRSSALGGVIRPNVIPGSSDSSRMYLRLLNTFAGPQMPPTGALPREEVDVIKRWIDAGAAWPDEWANEAASAAADAAAIELIARLRAGDRAGASTRVATQPSIVTRRGRAGETPLMAAVLYADAPLIVEMLAAGADVNARNDAGATPLMWALDRIDVARLLVERGADVNAVSGFGKTPLELAVTLPDAAPIVTLLLARGVTPSQNALVAAARARKADVLRLLLAAGARDSGAAALAALRVGCVDCLDLIAAGKPLPSMRAAVGGVLAPADSGRAETVRLALAHGGDVNARDGKLRTPLMLAAMSETLPAESIELLIARGAEVNATNPDGRTPLFFAKRLGRTSIVDALEKAGGTSEAEPTVSAPLAKSTTPREAVQRSLPLLQRTAVEFYRKSGCVSCHHNSLTAMTVAAARTKGLAVDEAHARAELATVTADVLAGRDQGLQGLVISGGGPTTTGYILLGLAAEGRPADEATDALVRLLRITQQTDGLWESAYRPPSEASRIAAAAVAIRGIRLYGRTAERDRDDATIDAARAALQRASPIDTEDRVFRLLGLAWAGGPSAAYQSARQDLLRLQRSDGGWAQLPTLPSDAYATGSALVALREAGMPASDVAYRRGVQFLLTTQLADGSWYVRTRSQPTQTYRESGFPHGEHQFISAAATNWAAQALLHAVDRGRPR